jgi:hypothetical protein
MAHPMLYIPSTAQYVAYASMQVVSQAIHKRLGDHFCQTSPWLHVAE